MAGAIAATEDEFLKRLSAGALPPPSRPVNDSPLSPTGLVALLETQFTSRRLDLEARRLGAEGRGFYSIGSSGHEGNAGIAHALRLTDMAFLHYRSGAFMLERARKHRGSTPIWDMALSFVASSDDPISGGRHKVIGSRDLFIPPQTSTIASHLPKAVGAAYSIPLARSLKKFDAPLPHDAIIMCSFGDASSNHSTAQGAINAAALTCFRGVPLPLMFVCEDNGIGISVPTPEGWIAQNYDNRPGLKYFYADGRDIGDVVRVAGAAERYARQRRAPVFLHLKTVRLMGHAGSDVEHGYRQRDVIARSFDDDPLLHTTRIACESGAASLEEIQTLYSSLSDRVARVMEEAATRPKLTTAAEVVSSISVEPKNSLTRRPGRLLPTAPNEARAKSTPQHLSRLISLTLANEMERDGSIAVFGEDVGKKGGVYGVTTKLQEKFGPARVFDTHLDEQSILGLAIGLAHNGFIPSPEIQFLAYVHNAEDQLRGEAATLSFFSNCQFDNPMVVRVAGLGYQKGFGGHFHNDNSVAIFRDIPGLILACPSNGESAVRMMRECFRLACEERRVVVFVEPIALYGTKHINDGDNAMTAVFDDIDDAQRFGDVTVYGDGKDLAIITYGNGTYMSRRVANTITKAGVKHRIIDLGWLAPLPIKAVLNNIKDVKNILIVDECRESGSISEELFTKLQERQSGLNLGRLCSVDSFIPLGPAANAVLISEDDIAKTAIELAGGRAK